VDQRASRTATTHPTTVGEMRSHHLFCALARLLWSFESSTTAVTAATFSSGGC
jgi:hypothetical protein